MKLSGARLGALIWILIYGGLLGASGGYALQRAGQSYGWGLVACGAAAVVTGVVMIWVRSRMRAP